VSDIGDRIDLVARNLVSGLNATDAAVLDLADRVAALEERLSSLCSGNPDVPLAPERGSNPNLRDRIAAAIDQKYNEEAIGHTYEVCLHAADAVIRELGLEPHLAKRIINGKPDQWVRRLVTDWEIVDE